ncbi:MAG: trigger factor [Acidobacteria bacterium]|nr:trigger factor [Acidobacteriota bacterium]
MKVEVAVADSAQCKKDVTIEIPADTVREEFEKAARAFAQHARVPGFRPGHAPLTIVKQRFRKDIRDEVLGSLVPHALQHAVTDHKLRVIGNPEIGELNLNEGEALRFTVSFEVLPDFELAAYKGLKLTKRTPAISDEDVDRVLENWRERAAQMVPVEDRASQDGDLVSVNLSGVFIEPPGDENMDAEDVVIEIGAEGVQSEFTENLRGVRAEDVKQFRVVYPEDFSSPGLAGKTLDFTATVVAVRRKELPALDDDFAREVGEETLDELRAGVRGGLERQAEAHAARQLRESAVDELLRSYNFPLPESIIESQADELMRELVYMMIRNGVPPQSLRGMDWEERRKEARERAERDVRAALVIENIADVEDIKVDGDEMDAEIERMADEEGESAEALAARLTKEDRLSSIENRLRYRKTVEFIVNNAQIAEETITGEEVVEEVITEDIEAEDVIADNAVADNALAENALTEDALTEDAAAGAQEPQPTPSEP